MAEGQVLVDKASMNMLIIEFDNLKRENEALRENLEAALGTQDQASQNLQAVTEALHRVKNELSNSENHVKVQTELLTLKDMQLRLAKKGFLELYNQIREKNVHIDIDIDYVYPSLRPSELVSFNKEELEQMAHECELIRAEITKFASAREMSASQGASRHISFAATPRAATARLDRSGYSLVESSNANVQQKLEELAILKAEHEALQRDNRELSLQVRKLINEAAAQKSTLAASQSNMISRDDYLLEKHRLEKLANELRNSLDSTRMSADMLQQALDQEKERALRLQGERDDLTQQLYQARDELEQMRAQFLAKSRHFDRSSTTLEGHVQTLEEDNQKLAEHVAKLSTDYHQMVQQDKLKDESITLLKAEKEALLDQIKTLTQDIETLGVEFQSRESELEVAAASLEQLLNKEIYDAPVQTDVMADQSVIITIGEFRDAKREIRERGKRRIIHKVISILNLNGEKADLTVEKSLRLDSSQGADLATSMLDSGIQGVTMSEEEFIDNLMVLKTDMVAKFGEMKGLKEKVIRLMEDLSEHERVSGELQRRAENAEKNLASLRAEMEETQTQVDVLKKREEKAIEDLKMENNALATRLLEIQQKDENSRTHTRDMMNALEEKTINLDKAQQELNWNQVKIGQLERRVVELEEELSSHITGGFQTDRHVDALKKAYEAKIMELNAEIDQRDADLNRILKEQMARYAEQRAELEAVVRAPSSRPQNQGLLDELVNMQKMYEDARGEQYKLIAEIRAKEIECDELSSRNAYLTQEKDRLQALLDESSRTARTMRNDEIEQHTQILSDYERRLREKDSMVDELLGKASKLEIEKKSLAADFTDAETRLKAALATSEDLAEQVADYKARVSSLELENRQQITELTMQKARLTSARTGDSEKDKIIISLQESIKNYEKELSGYQSEIESLKGLITTRTKFLEAANNELAGIKKKHDMDTDKFKATIKQLNSRISELDILLSNAHKDDALLSSYRQKIRDLENALQTERETAEASRKAYKAEQRQEFKELENKMKQLSYAVDERDSLRQEKKRLLKEVQRMKDERSKMIKEHEEAMMGMLRNADEETETDRETMFTRERFDYYRSQAKKYKDLYRRAFNVVEKMKTKEREMKNIIIQLEDKLFEMGAKRDDIIVSGPNRDNSRANYSTTSVNGDSQSESRTRGSSRQGSRASSRSRQRKSDTSVDSNKVGRANSPIIPVNLAYKPSVQK